MVMTCAAGMQVLLADQWLADHAQDGQPIARFAQPLTRRPADTARDNLTRLGFDLQAFDALAQRQHSVEQRGHASIDDVAAPTAGLLASLFAQVPGVIAQHHHDHDVDTATGDTLHALGWHLGRAIYLIDALEDLERDAQFGDFNPCLEEHEEGGRSLSTHRLEDVCGRLNASLEAIRGCVSQVPWRRQQGVIRHLLLDRLPQRARHAITQARNVSFARVEDATWLRRYGLMVVWLITGVWSMLYTRVQQARTRRHARQTCRVDPALACTPIAPVAAGPAAGMDTWAMVTFGNDEDDENERRKRQDSYADSVATDTAECCCECGSCGDCCACDLDCSLCGDGCPGCGSCGCDSCCSCDGGCDCGCDC